MEKLLVFGDDGSPSADLAWRWIDAHRWPEWRIEVLTAQMPPFGPPVDERDAQSHEWEPQFPRIPSSERADVRHCVAVADPRVALFRADASLIVIGPRGGGLLKALHLGSTAEYLLHHPPAPVVIVRSPRRVARALVCADGSAHAERAAEALAAMPWVGDVAVTILGVEEVGRDVERGAKHAHGVLEPVAADVFLRRADGAVAQTILEERDRIDADLIVMGTRGLSGLRRLVIGSAAAAVARSAPSSVLIANAEMS